MRAETAPGAVVRHSSRIADMIIERLLQDTPDWMYRGECSSSRVDHLDVDQREAAQANCSRCPFTTECLDWALEHQVARGVWGGQEVSEFLADGRRRQGPSV